MKYQYVMYLTSPNHYVILYLTMTSVIARDRLAPATTVSFRVAPWSLWCCSFLDVPNAPNFTVPRGGSYRHSYAQVSLGLECAGI